MLVSVHKTNLGLMAAKREGFRLYAHDDDRNAAPAVYKRYLGSRRHTADLGKPACRNERKTRSILSVRSDVVTLRKMFTATRPVLKRASGQSEINTHNLETETSRHSRLSIHSRLTCRVCILS